MRPKIFNTSIIDLFKEMRYSEKRTQKPKNKKFAVVPGKSVKCVFSSSNNDLSEYENHLIEDYEEEESDMIDENFSEDDNHNNNNAEGYSGDDDLPFTLWQSIY